MMAMWLLRMSLQRFLHLKGREPIWFGMQTKEKRTQEDEQRNKKQANARAHIRLHVVHSKTQDS